MELRIHDLQGRVVRTLASGLYAAGSHTLWWHGVDDQGRRLSSDLYLARWQTQEQQQIHHLMLVRS